MEHWLNELIRDTEVPGTKSTNHTSTSPKLNSGFRVEWLLDGRFCYSAYIVE